MIKKELRCIHRHTISEHPKCFVKGLLKEEVNEKEWIKATGLPWYNFPGYKIGYFDIETTGFDADFSAVLSWAIKEKGGETKTFVITKEDLFNGLEDKRVVEAFVNELNSYGIIIGYYSTNFDLPFMRSKALHYGLEFPSYGDLFHWDLFYTVKSKLKLSRNSLDAACDFLNISGKTPLRREVWRKARYGDPKALKEVVAHNIGDVEILEILHDKLEFSRKWIKKSI